MSIDDILNGPSGEPEGVKPPALVAVGAMKARDTIEAALVALVTEAQHHDTGTIQQAALDLRQQQEGPQSAQAMATLVCLNAILDLVAARGKGEPIVPRDGDGSSQG